MSFRMPPRMHNAQGAMRRVGIELEFAGITPKENARLVQGVFGGTIRAENEFSWRVTGTEFGDFGILLDASLLKDKLYEEYLAKIGIELPPDLSHSLANHLLRISAVLVPFEIVTPPIPFGRLETIETLRERLHACEARGTRASVLYAFGLHFNPEAPSLDPETLLLYLRAFLLLYPWLRRKSAIDLSRRIAPYIHEFPPDYVRLILRADYDARGFLPDFLRYNATRNRPLDMLPLLSLIDHDQVMESEVERHLIKPRPAFHYRLPNCLIDDPQWTLAEEWNRWVEVEELAADPEHLRQLAGEYLAEGAGKQDELWADRIDEWLSGGRDRS